MPVLAIAAALAASLAPAPIPATGTAVAAGDQTPAFTSCGRLPGVAVADIQALRTPCETARLLTLAIEYSGQHLTRVERWRCRWTMRTEAEFDVTCTSRPGRVVTARYGVF